MGWEVSCTGRCTCCGIVSRGHDWECFSSLVGQQEPDRCPCECVSVRRSCEHPQRLYNERGMSADTGAVCVRIQSRIVGVHPQLPPWQHTSDELRDASHTRDRLCGSVHLCRRRNRVLSWAAWSLGPMNLSSSVILISQTSTGLSAKLEWHSN